MYTVAKKLLFFYIPYGFVCACFVAWYTVYVAYDVHLPVLMVQ